MMTSTIRKFGVGVASLALVASAAAPAFAANNQEVPGPINGMVHLDRLGGYDRIDTAIQIAEKAFEDNHGVEVAYIAGAADASAVDSAAAGHLSDGPLYLVSDSPRSQKDVAASINKVFTNVQKIIAIGGTAAVSDSALKTVADMTDVTKTGRISGKDRYETAAAIAEYGSNNIGLSEGNQFYANRELIKDGGARLEGSKVYLARGDNPVDALVSGVLDDAPVLLLGPDGSVPEATAAYLKKYLPTNFVALGGDKAVPTSSFMKADFDPVMKNVWTNDDAVKKAIAEVERNSQLLNGLPGGGSVNPTHIGPYQAKWGLGYKDIEALDAAIARLQAQVNAAETKAAPQARALKNAKDTLAQALKTAKAQAAVSDPAYQAAIAKNDLYYGKGDFGATSGTAGRGQANYPGSLELAERAQAKLDDFNKAMEIRSVIKTAVDKFMADIQLAGGTVTDDDKKKELSKALYESVKDYVSYYYDGSTHQPISDLNNDTAATAFAAAEHFAGSTNGWRNASGGMAGFVADEGTNGDSVNAAGKYAPTNEFKNSAARADRMTTNRKMSSAATSSTTEARIDFLGLKGAADLLVTGATVDQKIAKAREDLESALAQAQALRDVDAKSVPSVEDLEALAVAYAEKTSGYKSAKDAVDKAQKKYDEAVEGVSDTRATLNALKEMRKIGAWNYGFKGYKRIEQQYSVLEGEHSNAMRALESAISLRVSQLKNEETPTPDDVANDSIMKAALEITYGVDLTGSNVKEFFAFKTVNGVEKVSHANFKRLRSTSQSNDIVVKAKQLIDEFYRLNQDGFNTGEMLSYFSTAGQGWRHNYGTYTSIWNQATEADKKLYDDAAKAVWDALNADADRGVSKVSVGSILTVWDTWNPARRNAAAQVSKYLLEIAQENRRTVEADLAKAKLALQAALDKVLPKRYDRIEGSDRYNTSAAIAAYWRARYMGLDNARETTSVYVANGISYIDAVAGGQLKNGPIVLVAPDGKLTDAVKQRFAYGLTDAKVLNITALGGTKVVSDQTLADAKAAARDKSWLGKNLFTDATNKANDNAKDKDKKTDDKKADEKKADEKKADDKK